MLNLENLYKTMKERKISASKLAKDNNISTGNVSDWKMGRSNPKTETLIKIADYLGVSIDYLVGRTDNPEINKWNL